MSRSSAPKQDTINRWCNAEAVNAWADRLEDWARRKSWYDDGNPRALRNAAGALRAAASYAASAINTAQNDAYDRLLRPGVGRRGGVDG